MRKYSGSTGLKAVPNIPSTFVPRSSPHFVAALSGKGQQQPQRKASVHQNPTSSLIHPTKKHSVSCFSYLPMIQVTMEDSEDKVGKVQRKGSSSASPSGTRTGSNLFDTRQSNTAASSANDRPEKDRVVPGDTPLGRDVIFRRKISNTSTPKIDKDEEKKRLLLKYTTLNNVPLSGNNSTKRMKTTYLSTNIVQAEVRRKNTGVFHSLSEADRAKESDSNCTTRGRTQNLNFQLNAQVKRKTTFVGHQVIGERYARSRAKSLTFVPNGSKSGNGLSGARAINDKTN